MEYLGRTDFVQVKPEELEKLEAEKALTSPTASTSEVKAAAQTLAKTSESIPVYKIENASSALSAHLGTMMGDAPFCNICGHITVRNGACYKCLNCGNSLGCS
jgi:ribonucleoside-diphosphate reductase alpha chain